MAAPWSLWFLWVDLDAAGSGFRLVCAPRRSAEPSAGHAEPSEPSEPSENSSGVDL